MNTVWLNKDAYMRILEEAIRKMPRETGGVLIGYWVSPNIALVTDIVGPGPKAIHKPSSFVPDSEYHNAEVSRHYQDSGRIETYLGDWHTHPYAKAYMSGRDRKTLKGIAAFKEARLEKPIMMILGTQPFGLRAWTHIDRCSYWVGSAIVSCELKLY